MARRALAELKEWRLEHPDQDLRGRDMVDESGRKIGTIDEMIVDTDLQRVVAVRLDDGREFSTDSFEIRDRQPVLVSREARMPEAREARMPEAPRPEAGAERPSEVLRIPVREEEAVIQKRTVEAGEARVHKEVVTEQERFTVPTEHEELHVERHRVDRPSEQPVGEERDYRIPLREEEVEVTKRPVVREEIEISKEVEREETPVTAELKHEKVTIEPGPGHEGHKHRPAERREREKK